MALFKIFKGNSSNLSSQQLKEGYCYVTTDEYKFYVDINDNLRVPLNAHQADTALTANVALAADKWSNARIIAYAGDVTGSVTIDGSKDVKVNLYFSKQVLINGESHAKTDVSNGGGTSLYYGHVKLSDEYQDSSYKSDSSIAATPYAVSQVYKNSLRANPSSIEIFGNKYPYIDFHYNNSSSDYTSRIIERSAGTLSIYNSTLEIYKSSSITDNNPATLLFTTSQTDNSINSTAFIKVYDDHDAYASGNNMVIQSGGNVIIGAGESPNTIYANELKNNTGENVYVTSDRNIYFYVGVNSGYSSTQKQVYITETGKLYGAVWNDYAEFRICNDKFKAGQVVCENGDDTLALSTKRLQPGANIVSDTFGFAIGETEEAKCPIAVSGRVLAYTYEDRNEFKPGEAVCAGPNGTVSRMTREEIREYPERIIGTVSAIPIYEFWGENNTKIDERIWIKIK